MLCADTLLMRTPFLPPRTWLPYLCVYKIKLLQQKYSALKYVNCLKITLTQGSTVHERSRFMSVEPCTDPPCMVKIRGRDESQWNVFATVYTRLSFPQWNLKIVLLSLSNPLSVLWRFRILFSIRNVLVFHKPLQSGHRLKFRFDLVRLIFRWFYLSWKFRLLREREIRQPYLDSHSGIQQTKKRQYLESHRNISSKPDQVCNN